MEKAACPTVARMVERGTLLWVLFCGLAVTSRGARYRVQRPLYDPETWRFWRACAPRWVSCCVRLLAVKF